MTKVVDRSQEKLALAKELELDEYVRSREKEIEVKKELENLTNMKFKLTSEREIKKALTKLYWHGVNFEREGAQFWSFIIGIGGLLTAIVVAGVLGMEKGILVQAKLFGLYSLIAFGVWSFGLLLTCVRFCDVRQTRLREWTEELPFGALLAVKEAKERGFKNFSIYYPCKADYYQPIRLLLDPIITSEKAGLLVEIYAWDDSKIHE